MLQGCVFVFKFTAHILFFCFFPFGQDSSLDRKGEREIVIYGPGHLQYPVSIWFVCSTSELQQCQPREFLFLIVSLSSPPFLPFHWLSHLSGYLRLSISLISLIFKHAHVHSEMYYCSRFTIFGMLVSQMYGIICIGRLFDGFLAVPSLLFSP